MPEKIVKTFVFDATKPVLYNVEKTDTGCNIKREGLLDAKIKIDNNIEIEFHRNGVRHHSDLISIMNYPLLKEKMIDEIMFNWIQIRSDKLAAQGKTQFKCLPGKKLKEWAKAKFTKGLGYYLYPAWKSMLENVQPEVSSIHKKFFVTRGPKALVPRILMESKIFSNKAFINDLLTYNAIHLCLDKSIFDGDKIVFQFEGDYARVERKADNWRLLFSDIPKTYKALNKTLDNWPRGIPVNLAKKLNKIHLSEPIFDRIKIMAVIMANEHNSWQPDKINHVDCFMRSSPEQIRKAFKLFRKSYIKKHKSCSFTLRGHKGIQYFVNYVCDYDQKHEGEIIGLLEKSHRWHQDADLIRQARYELLRIEAIRREEEYVRLAPQRAAEYAIREAERLAEQEAEKLMPAKMPPIDLPENENIRFLKTVEEIIAEGVDMGHCIASYSRTAIKGECFLFHVDYNGEKASIMINNQGKVVQSYGPRNCVNKASEWATSQLTGWGIKLAKFMAAGEEAKIKDAMNEARVLV